MTDDEILQRFQEVRLPAGAFDHEQHVRTAFLCLVRYGFVEGLARYRTGLQQFAMRAGVPEKYHETVTCALLVLIHERIARCAEPVDWEAFARKNADLLIWKGGPFFEYYDEEVLTSEMARTTFVLPRPRGATVPVT